MEEWYKFIEILEASVKKNGADKPITLGHLLAITKMVERECNNGDGADIGDLHF